MYNYAGLATGTYHWKYIDSVLDNTKYLLALRGCSQMTSSPEGEGGGKPKDDEWWQMMTGGRGGVEQKMTRIYHPSIQCLCAQSFNLPGVNIFQWWLFFRGEYFSGVNIFQGWIFFREEYFSGVDIFQVWISFRGEYFSGVNIFLGGIFFRSESLSGVNIY